MQLSSARITTNSPGWVIAGHRAYSHATVYDFVIDKVDGSGTFGGVNEFSVEYRINDALSSLSSSCTTPARTYNCGGVCVIPTNNLGLGEAYALAGVHSWGVFFATLDNAGGVISTERWAFPDTAWYLKQPYILESTVNPGSYYICGDYEQEAYVIYVDMTSGTPITVFANTYSASILNARALIESPYANDELIVVGRVDNLPLDNKAADAFFMKLSTINGAVITFTSYNKQWDGDEWFESIQRATSTTGGDGYILGGRSHYRYDPPNCFPSCPTNQSSIRHSQWMCKLDRNGNIIWTTLIKPLAWDPSSPSVYPGGDISSVYERWNSNTNQHEYYGATSNVYMIDTVTGAVTSQSNVVVYKLDDNGQNSIRHNEFHYTDGSAESVAPSWGCADLTAIETGGGNDDGFQVFGHAPAVASSYLYFVKAYFNGASGCREYRVNIDSLFPGPDSISTSQVNVTVLGTPCNNLFSIDTTILSGPDASLCFASSLADGSNARGANILSLDKNKSGPELLTVYPNPSNNKIVLKYYASAKQRVTISVKSILGQKICEDHEEIVGNTGEQSFEFDFSRHNAAAGIYFLNLSVGDKRSALKVVYSADGL